MQANQHALETSYIHCNSTHSYRTQRTHLDVTQLSFMTQVNQPYKTHIIIQLITIQLNVAPENV